MTTLVERAQKEWTAIAGEEIEVEQVGGALYAFGSELATLRLLKAFRLNKYAGASWSQNLDKYYFSLEVRFSIDV